MTLKASNENNTAEREAETYEVEDSPTDSEGNVGVGIHHLLDVEAALGVRDGER